MVCIELSMIDGIGMMCALDRVDIVQHTESPAFIDVVWGEDSGTGIFLKIGVRQILHHPQKTFFLASFVGKAS